jgi:hypothetical protein
MKGYAYRCDQVDASYRWCLTGEAGYRSTRCTRLVAT